MSSTGNGSVDGVGTTIVRNLFWGWFVIRSWFNSKDKLFSNSPVGSAITAFKIAFAIVFFMISIPIGIIRVIFALLFMKKRNDTINANSGGNDQN